MINMSLSEQEFIIHSFRAKLVFEQLDAKMSNGAGMPEQWVNILTRYDIYPR